MLAIDIKQQFCSDKATSYEVDKSQQKALNYIWSRLKILHYPFKNFLRCISKFWSIFYQRIFTLLEYNSKLGRLCGGGSYA